MLYSDFEKGLMAKAVQPNMRNNLVAPQPFQAIVNDFLGDAQLNGKRILDIGPGQCDFLDIAAKRGAKTFGIDFDPCVARLGFERGHTVLTHNLQDGFPAVESKFDGIFCRASFNLYWFEKDLPRLRGFLENLGNAAHDGAWIWIVPWNKPASNELSPELEGVLDEWTQSMAIESRAPSPEEVRRYGLGYAIPKTMIWSRLTTASPRVSPRPSASHAKPTTGSSEVAPRADAVVPTGNAVLPVDYLLDLFRVLKSSGAQFQTPDDLDFSALDITNEQTYRQSLGRELTDWIKANPTRSSPAVMLFHDCDSGPNETLALAEHEGTLGVRSTVALFARYLQQGVEREYPLDFARFSEVAASSRHCVAYHCNAWELVGYDESKLAAAVARDIAQLERAGLGVTCFSAHGGAPSPDGRNNASFFYPALLSRPLVWTHCGFGLSGTRYSDGGFKSRWLRGDATLDLRAFLLSKWNASHRLILLLHPQYYFATARPTVTRSAEVAPWVKEYWDLHEAGRASDYWSPLADALQASAAAP